MILKANSGIAVAQAELGDMYCDNTGGVEQDYRLAMEWYQKVAAQDNNAKAQLKIGYLFHSGFGVPQDDAPPFECHLTSAEQSNAMAHIKWMLKATGRGLVEAECMTEVTYKSEGCADMNFDRIMNWSLKAAEKNVPPALGNIGDMYLFGEGVPKDDVRASEGYRMAAEQGYTSAQFSLGNPYKDGDGVP
ncbi:hypothetical protein KI688_006548 [Linnemannia hyalina]|uniref:HCP-like protein n=1 Tax=Linnemannia hyalina TaxID=64524 RepID=A0A9P8BNV3_9FUNG|nr:hypothetical protein KI688_006548 [Linnemannia hyalina]